MGGITNVDYNDLLIAKLGGLPELEYRLFWRGDAFIFDHGNSIFIESAIKRVEAAMHKLREENCLPKSMQENYTGGED